jgi:uncharacterized RDD family membrane protein YckC
MTMMTGLTTTGLTSHPTTVDPAIELCLPDPPLPKPSIDTAAPDASLSLADLNPADPNQDPADAGEKTDSWRVEVAARLERYRVRRKPRTPRYPSLLLPFDAPQSWSRPAQPSWVGSTTGAIAQAEPDFAFDSNPDPNLESHTNDINTNEAAVVAVTQQQPAHAEQSARIIEFPRSAAIPIYGRSELADPIFDRPRIVEAPEILPPPPALGGMLIEPVYKEAIDSHAADQPAGSASIPRRMLAALVDTAILAAALVACGAMFLRLNSVQVPLPMLVVALAVAGMALWTTYDFLFIVYTGSTPGLHAARLRLSSFDGSPINRRTRRWRVLASFLSAFSAGLGYLWALLDESGLCWHDRITRTHLQPNSTPK